MNSLCLNLCYIFHGAWLSSNVLYKVLALWLIEPGYSSLYTSSSLSLTSAPFAHIHALCHTVFLLLASNSTWELCKSKLRSSLLEADQRITANGIVEWNFLLHIVKILLWFQLFSSVLFHGTAGIQLIADRI